VPLYPCVPIAFLVTYGAVFVGTAVAAPRLVLVALVVLAGAYALSWTVARGGGVAQE
jgi:hypothetical protein